MYCIYIHARQTIPLCVCVCYICICAYMLGKPFHHGLLEVFVNFTARVSGGGENGGRGGGAGGGGVHVLLTHLSPHDAAVRVQV
jgi:uncharacterized membrane protein YgcG